MAVDTNCAEIGERYSTPQHEDLCTRTSYVDARIALAHINKGRATGNRGALWMRKKLQDQLDHVGRFAERHAGKIIFVAILTVAAGCVALKSATLITDIEKLWVEEGGRLEREMKYVSETLGKGSGTVNQILIQSLKKESKESNILTASSLLSHLNVLLAAVDIQVDMFDTSWGLNDLCYATSFPYFENHLIDQIFERLTPCSIITPLDCFWEGSKLLGPKYPVRIPGYGERKWTNLNPQKIVEKVQSFKDSKEFFPFSAFMRFMKRSGISTAYQQKPCLDPTDPDCPTTAPNKNDRKLPNIGAELTGGCYGFASEYLHWPEELIVGGTKKNRSNHIIRGEAVQSIVQLMGPKDLYDYWQDHYKVHNMDWSQQKAAEILDTWVKKYSQKVLEENELRADEMKYFNIYPFSSATLGEILKTFSQISVWRIALGYIIMTLYACICLIRVSKTSESGVGLGVSGVTLVTGAVVSGLGLCAVIGLPFNATSTQILPFLALGLGLNNMFLMAHTVDEIQLQKESNKHYRYSQVGDILKRSGISIIVSSVCTASAFFAAAIIPLPALRVLCLQCGIIVLVILAAMIVVFPAIISLDLRRRRAGRVDILCCLPMEPPLPNLESIPQQVPTVSRPMTDPLKKSSVTRTLSPSRTVTHVLNSTSSPQECWVGAGSMQVPNPSLESLTSESTRELVENPSLPPNRLDSFISCFGWSFSRWISDVYSPTLSQGSVKAITIFAFLTTLTAAAFGLSRIKEGLSLTDIVPKETPEASFFEAQSNYFGFYNMFAVTQGNFEYPDPSNQKILNEYYESFNRIPWIIKNDDGGLPDSWIVLLKKWLLGLQKAFDNDWDKKLITQEGWQPEASDDGILAYKLLVQTGHLDHPVDKSAVSQNRLVSSEGIINPKAFYNYLTAWTSNDALAYRASKADLRPAPRFWHHERTDYDLKIPKSSPIIYGQFPFYLNHLEETETITQMIEEVRDICRKFEEKGLPNFPKGIPFTFWEQYIKLKFFLLLALAAVLITVFLILSIILVNLWAASIIVLMLSALVLQLAGLLGLLGLKLSAAPAVLLIVAVGAGVQFTIHITLGFLTSIGDRNRRVRKALTHMTLPVLHGAAATLIAVLMLLCSEFEFIRRYFFYILVAIVLLGMLDGVLFLPVLLSIIGPPADLISQSSSDRVATPSPPPSPPPPYNTTSYAPPNRRSFNSYSHNSLSMQQNQRGSSSSKSSRLYPSLHGSNLSLTTITEESDSGGSTGSSKQSAAVAASPSHEILVEPQVVVETTTYPSSARSSGTPSSSSDNTESVVYHEGGHVTTTVTATAKVKVEVHKPYHGSLDSSCRNNSNCDLSASSRRVSRGNSRYSPTNISVSSSRSSNSSSGVRRSNEFDSETEKSSSS